LLNARPLGRDAVAALLAEAREYAAGTPDPWIEADIEVIAQRAEALGRVRDVRMDGRLVMGTAPVVPTGLERAGDRFNDGTNFRLGADLGGSIGTWFAWGYHPELRYPVGVNDDLDVATRAAYAELAGGGLALTVGRESVWWGPGFRGTLLLTDNAQPFDLVRVESSRPWRVKWIGPMTVHVFVTRLEADRQAIPKPYLAGLRLAFRPVSQLEFGLSRTAMFGGEGRPVTADLIWDVVRARGENNVQNPGNQIAGFDVTVRIPWRRQPAALYLEWGGEDEANAMPSHPAVVAGVYLPRLLGVDHWEFRTEYADNTFAEVPGVWYQHSIYQSGYTYHGLVIGHPMGTDARMISAELERRITPEWSVSALYDGLQSGVFGPGETSARSGGARLGYDSGTRWMTMEYRYTRLEEPLGPSRDHGQVVSLSFETTW
jgi:hypothetical protein